MSLQCNLHFQRIVDWLAGNFKNDEGIDLLKDKQALQRLTEAAEKAKMEQALRDFAKKKMAELFKNHKKRLRVLIKKDKTLDSEKVKNH